MYLVGGKTRFACSEGIYLKIFFSRKKKRKLPVEHSRIILQFIESSVQMYKNQLNRITFLATTSCQETILTDMWLILNDIYTLFFLAL